MSEQQQEEQEMEAEALTAIFDDHFSIVQGDAQPFVWKVELWPEATGEDEENHVGISLEITLPATYPDDDALPECSVSIVKGLTVDHAATLLALANEEAQNNAGLPSIFAICEILREWLVEHNQKGHDDVSMHAQMLRRNAEQERKEQQQQQQSEFESQKNTEEMTETEREDLALRRRRADGTPVTTASFAEWKLTFEKEMQELKEERAREEDLAASGGRKKGKGKPDAAGKDDHKIGRVSGKEQFSDKAFNLEALEAAAENALADPDEEEDEDEDDDEEDDEDNSDDDDEKIQEELFDVDDEDLDDLDFDDDDDDDEDVDI